jgi:hypothetical protein
MEKLLSFFFGPFTLLQPTAASVGAFERAFCNVYTVVSDLK